MTSPRVMKASTAEELLEGLNPEQKEAVAHGEGPMLVLAGAGSGKTRVITHRIAHLIALGAAPHSIVAVTFTNKAAREMKERALRLLGTENTPVFVGTFHSFALRLLRRHAPLLGYTARFSVYDTSDQLALVKRVAAAAELAEKAFPAKALLGRISSAKNQLQGPAEFARTNSDFYGVRVSQVYQQYQKQLRAADAMDFDDLIGNAVGLFAPSLIDPSTGQPLAESLRSRMRHFLIDEYQDTNHAQAELVRALSLESKNLCVVGDDDQSIYRWRGAMVGNILEFENEFPGARIVKLERNYRSTGRILKAASAVVNKNSRRHRKNLWTEKGEGRKIFLYVARDERDEAHWVGGEIAASLGEGKRLSDTAVLFRTNAQSRPFEDELRRRDWPYVLVGGVKFYERTEIKDTLSYLRLAVHPADDGAFLRIVNVPARGIGAATIETLRSAATAAGCSLWQTISGQKPASGVQTPPPGEIDSRSAQTHFSDMFETPSSSQSPVSVELGERARRALAEFRATVEDVARATESRPPAETLTYLLERTGYRALYQKSDDPQDLSRLENLDELLRAAEEFEEAEPGATASDFVDAVALTADVDQFKESDDRGVILMTLHSAKGLEFPNVFLAGVEEGLLPHRSSMDDPEELDEERRLAYVGMTRAKERLSLSLARFRSLYGQSNEARPSQFLDDLPADAIETIRGFEEETSSRGGEDWEDGESEDTGHRAPGLFPSRGGRVHDGPTIFRQEPRRAALPPGRPGELRKGMKVRHAQYGVGVILMEEGSGDGKKFTVYFDRVGRKKLVAKYAPLQAV